MGASQGGSEVQGPANGTLSGTVVDPSADPTKKKKTDALGAAGAGIAQGLASLDQQPQQVAAGPQLGQGVNQAQVTDPYQAYLLKLQQQNQQQTPFYGN